MTQTINPKLPPFETGPALELLEKLCNATSVTGDESEVRTLVLEQVKAFADEVKVDALGNVLVSRFGKDEKRLRVMLSAHMEKSAS